MRILLTGGSGFTGRSLLPMLENSGFEVCHLVRKKKGYKEEFLWNFADDLPNGLPECAVVIHLAAYVNFGQTLEWAQYNVNTVSSLKLAAYAQSHDAYFILASIVSVHGLNSTIIDEKTPLNPDNNYALSKYLAEQVVKTFTKKYSILRIAGIYGLDGPEHLGLNKTISDAFYRKMKPTLVGPGKAKRNYICVHDVARWILHLVQSFEERRELKKNSLKETLYFAGPEIMSIENYLEKVVEILLSGMGVMRVAGSENKDLIVKFSPFPFEPLTFRQYLTSLKQSD
jgi:UDP-glucose 4-epimerase